MGCSLKNDLKFVYKHSKAVQWLHIIYLVLVKIWYIDGLAV